jgi:hypothetical protein
MSICADDRVAMIERFEWVLAFAKQDRERERERQNSSLITTDRFIHPEALTVKRVDGRDFANVLTVVIKMINSIKHRAAKSKLFSTLYSDMGAENKTLLHTEMLNVIPNRGPRAAGRNALTFWDKDPEFSEKFCDTLWCAALTHLAHILLKLNTLNSSLQGAKANFISAGDEMTAASRLCTENIIRKWGFVEFPRRFCKSAKT